MTTVRVATFNLENFDETGAGHHRGSEIHNELLHDESAAFAVDRRYPESDHAPVVAILEFDQ